MPQFRFKLQKVLEARQTFEDIAKREFAKARTELTKQMEILEDLLNQRENFLLVMSERRKRKSTVKEFQNDLQHEWQFRMHIRDQRHVITKAREELEKKRQKLIQAVKEKRILEILRDKQKRKFIENLKKQEIKFADDIAGRNAHLSEKFILEE